MSSECEYNNHFLCVLNIKLNYSDKIPIFLIIFFVILNTLLHFLYIFKEDYIAIKYSF